MVSFGFQSVFLHLVANDVYIARTLSEWRSTIILPKSSPSTSHPQPGVVLKAKQKNSRKSITMSIVNDRISRYRHFRETMLKETSGPPSVVKVCKQANSKLLADEEADSKLNPTSIKNYIEFETLAKTFANATNDPSWLITSSASTCSLYHDRKLRLFAEVLQLGIEFPESCSKVMTSDDKRSSLAIVKKVE